VAFALGCAVRQPDRARPNSERHQQSGEFALRELTGLPIVAYSAPFVPWRIRHGEQYLDQIRIPGQPT
jgi:hypothetical protein